MTCSPTNEQTNCSFPLTSRVVGPFATENPPAPSEPKSSLRSLILKTPANTVNQDQLPSFWSSPPNSNSPAGRRRWWNGLLNGWRLIVFHSWLNLLLVFIPVSWALDLAKEKSHSLIFALCVMSLIPLVKLHDFCTRELAIRIGGNKTGLLNASLSNMVEIVVAISALRRCELRVVQSALVGSILSKLLLVLGLCFFAGGMRFSEQGFDATATQMHSSLLSISVGAILLPAAYHFTLEDHMNHTPVPQGRYILHMSHGVSIVLLFIYSAYLVFQLWSHKHLYHDRHNKKSQPLPVQVRVGVPKSANVVKHVRKRIASSFSTLETPNTLSRSLRDPDIALQERSTQKQYFPSDSQLSLNVPPESPKHATSDSTAAHGAQCVAHPPDSLGSREGASSSVQSSDSTIFDPTASCERLGRVTHVPEEPQIQRSSVVLNEPQLSWTITLGLMVIVTVVVAFTAESLVESMDGVSSTISKEWIGLIVLPSVSAVAECITAVNVSVRDELTLSVSVAVGSSIQTALFVFPVMVILAWISQKPLSLLLDPFQSIVLYLSVQIMNHVVADGKSNWLEGVILICLYVIIAVSFWFYPGSNLPATLAHCAAPDLEPF